MWQFDSANRTMRMLVKDCTTRHSRLLMLRSGVTGMFTVANDSTKGTADAVIILNVCGLLVGICHNTRRLRYFSINLVRNSGLIRVLFILLIPLDKSS